MSVWSPSQVNKWLECPVKWSLGRQGVVGVREKWSPGMVVGTALHAGLAHAYTLPFDGARGDELTPDDTARGVLEKEWPEEHGEFEVDMVMPKMLGALGRAMDKRGELLGEDGVVEGVEVKLGPGDRESGEYPGTADLITSHSDPAGIGHGGRYLAVTDWKSHWTLDEYYLEKELSETERNWQLHQYAWFAQELYGLPVRYLRKVTIRCLPTPKAWVYTHQVSQERLKAWRMYASVTWAQMTANVDTGMYAPNWQSCRKYGRCEYYHRVECHGGV